jgi:anti-sigma regulatory factor (Ser/Thr protein kinase)
VAAFRPREHPISADVNRLKEVRDFAERAAAEFGFDAHGRAEVKLAISEAVTNAIRHGSRTPDDPIRIVAAEESGALVFEVLDTGHFVPRVMRGRVPESGRGLEFMRLMMDEVDLRPSRRGTLLRLVKRLG